ncbi:pentapeptide repeat-containing protein [Pseudofrancisella aestuarii]|uniref:Pentapeptide repeat-containing protein n=1 Tax=Pseudofrancisella aestuarii TaxID=2670347 RepID=A0ABV9TBZ0_9GAMM|nr:pentapeptide repeat-containing protein [Pseudofrancisella aestuarii]
MENQIYLRSIEKGNFSKKLIFKLSDDRTIELIINSKKVDITALSSFMHKRTNYPACCNEFEIIENVEQIGSMKLYENYIFLCNISGLLKTKNKIFFNNCIFTKKILINDLDKIESVSFNNSLFLMNISLSGKYDGEYETRVNFSNSEFIRGVHIFSNLKEIDLLNSCFREELGIYNNYEMVSTKKSFRLHNCHFIKSVFLKLGEINIDGPLPYHISDSIFYSEVDFRGSIFIDPIVFSRVEFKGSVNFAGVIFRQPVIFLYSKVYKNMIFRKTVFEKSLNLAYLYFLDDGCLDIYNINIKNFDSGKGLSWENSSIFPNYKNTNQIKTKEIISDQDAKETYRILKKEALKQSDTISAIEFYKQECEKYYKSISKIRNFGNKFVLFFEKIVSNYGTSIIRSILSLIIFNFYYYLLVQLFINQGDLNYSMVSILNGVMGVMLPHVLGGYDISYIPITSRSLHIIINAILLYEVIKSFRKYSRKL